MVGGGTVAAERYKGTAMSLPPTKKLKTAGERDGVDATSEGGTSIEVVDLAVLDGVAGGETFTGTASAAVAPANQAVPDAILARILRRREELTLPRVRLELERRVEYEFAADDSLLNIDHEQSERLISFLVERERENDEDSAVWLSERCFLGLGCPSSRHPAQQPWHVACNVNFSSDWTTPRGLIRIYLFGTQASLSTQPIAEGDALLRILSKHRGISHLGFEPRAGTSSIPVSVAGLQLLVSDIPSGRHLLQPHYSQWDAPTKYSRSSTVFSFSYGRLSEEHKRVLAFHCHRDVWLNVRVGPWSFGNGLDLLLEAIRLNVCPTRLSLYKLVDLTANQLQSLFEAIESNTCLESLQMFLPDVELHPAGAATVIRSLSRNKGLRYISLYEGAVRILISSTCWKLFWACIAEHPTLQVLQLWGTLDCPEAQLEEMAECMQSSKVLQTLWVRQDTDVFQRVPILRDRVLPVLELNRFRPKVETLMNQPDPKSRSRAFWNALIDDNDVRHNLTLVFYLLTEATDAFVESVSRPMAGR